jgi:hypothetical protein
MKKHNLNLSESKKKKYSERVLEKNASLFSKYDWGMICINQKLSEKFIEKYKNKIDWELISIYQNLSQDFIEKYSNKVHWKYISFFQRRISLNFIEKHSEKVNWRNISACRKLNYDFIMRNISKIDIPSLLKNKKACKKAKKEIKALREIIA